MKEKVDLLLERGYFFDFLAPSQTGAIPLDGKVVQVKHNDTDYEINNLLDLHIEFSNLLENSSYEKLKKYVEKQKKIKKNYERKNR